MKRSKNCKYQVPRVALTSLETEGICSRSVMFNLELEETDNMNLGVDESQRGTPDDPYFLDF